MVHPRQLLCAVYSVTLPPSPDLSWPLSTGCVPQEAAPGTASARCLSPPALRCAWPMGHWKVGREGDWDISSPPPLPACHGWVMPSPKGPASQVRPSIRRRGRETWAEAGQESRSKARRQRHAPGAASLEAWRAGLGQEALECLSSMAQSMPRACVAGQGPEAAGRDPKHGSETPGPSCPRRTHRCAQQLSAGWALHGILPSPVLQQKALFPAPQRAKGTCTGPAPSDAESPLQVRAGASPGAVADGLPQRASHFLEALKAWWPCDM